MEKRVGVVSIIAGTLGLLAGALTLASGILFLLDAQKRLTSAKSE